MADQETIPIGLETQNKVAEAIYLRWYRNGARHPRPWNEMPMERDAHGRQRAMEARGQGRPRRKRRRGAAVSVNVPLHKWRSADPAILIGRRCIAQTDQDVIIDGRLELIRHPDGAATLRFPGIGNDIISHDPNTCSNSMSDGIRSLAIYGKE